MRGHIRQRGKSLEARVFAGQVDGRKRYLTKTVRWQGSKKATRTAAEAELTKLLAELDGGAHTGPDATVNTLLDRWWSQKLGTSKRPGWSPSTAQGYHSYLEKHVRPWFGTMLVRKVRTEDVDRFLVHLRGQDLAGSTRAKALNIVRSSFRQAVRWGWIATNPAQNADRPSLDYPAIVPPAPADVRRLIALAQTSDPDWATFIELDAVTGARAGELCGLRWEDLNGANLTIRRGIVRSLDGWVVRDTTKGKRERTIPLDKNTVRLLAVHKRRCQERASTCGVKCEGFMFACSPDGSDPWKPGAVSMRFSRLRAKLDLDDVRLHDIRHYLATRLLDAGTPGATVAQRLGHKNETITRSIYGHSVTESETVAAETAARMLRG